MASPHRLQLLDSGQPKNDYILAGEKKPLGVFPDISDFPLDIVI